MSAQDMWPSCVLTPDQFAERVLGQGEAHFRELPWRFIDDAYGVLVSEVMLQQTQVSRVLVRWPRFMRVFPSIDALAAAATSDVLAEWQGLGYNRRALALKRAAELCAANYAGKLPESYGELLALPGVGPATAAGVIAFAFNRPSVYVETNVRAVFLHEVFPDRDQIPDREIAPLVKLTCPTHDPRRWYYALLDYGAHLKATLPNPSRRSAHYAKQSAFEGSRRQKRAELVRIVLAGESVSREKAAAALDEFERSHGRGPLHPDLFESLVADLTAEGFFADEGGVLCVDDTESEG
ncbi:adenine glycosylase [Adlercreutzia sp. ZJ138]|uniref:adenine glycosylase n=1 Tax=Adlercreutzia sp. ZJ138 TaxID=2709405 RepID=UPI0013EDB53D|nr:adenine glycosylase [Adlercreutzia sp. ZJ138]